jgi:glycosyltransferase involved in cell wall biosynthesis
LGRIAVIGSVALGRPDASSEPNVRSSSLRPRTTPFLSPTAALPSADVPARSFGILSSFPPTACGIATFSAALAAGLVANGGTVDVVRCGATPDIEDPLVLASLDDHTPGGLAAAVDVLDRTDVAIIQHEYGIYRGADGDEVLAVLDAIVAPSILVAHTVVRNPTPHQRFVLERACDAADAVVVMTESAHDRLLDGFDVDASKVGIIPHGAATPLTEAPTAGERPPNRAARLLTWGLLGPGKGIEWAIDAVGDLCDVRPRPTYLVAGATHPKVLARDGESYRQMLVTRACSSGASPFITFDDTYRDLAELTELISSADLVVLPYDSDDQVTSGVLVDAVAAGRPVVSTAFPHAVELLGTGAGLVVPQRDPRALAAAIRSVITDTELADEMAAEARRLAPELSWNAIARRYDRLGDDVLGINETVPA